MKTITTVDELEALPEGAVIAFEDIGTPSAAVLASTEDGPRWWTTVDAPSANGYGYPHESIWHLYGEDGESGITLLHPVIFDAADVERAARALAEARYEGCPLEDLADIHLAEMLDQARAVLGAVGSVEA